MGYQIHSNFKNEKRNKLPVRGEWMELFAEGINDDHIKIPKDH